MASAFLKIVAGIKEEGFLTDVEEVLTTKHGDPVAINRIFVHAELAKVWTGRMRVGVLGALVRQDRPNGVLGVLRPTKEVPAESWLKAEDWKLAVVPGMSINLPGMSMNFRPPTRTHSFLVQAFNV